MPTTRDAKITATVNQLKRWSYEKFVSEVSQGMCSKIPHSHLPKPTPKEWMKRQEQRVEITMKHNQVVMTVCAPSRCGDREPGLSPQHRCIWIETSKEGQTRTSIREHPHSWENLATYAISLWTVALLRLWFFFVCRLLCLPYIRSDTLESSV